MVSQLEASMLITETEMETSTMATTQLLTAMFDTGKMKVHQGKQWNAPTTRTSPTAAQHVTSATGLLTSSTTAAQDVV